MTWPPLSETARTCECVERDRGTGPLHDRLLLLYSDDIDLHGGPTRLPLMLLLAAVDGEELAAVWTAAGL